MLTPSSSLVELLSGRPVSRVRPGLERVEELLDRVGHPQRRFRSLHIAGTNGKGSVASSVASILARSGRRVGLYTSPHLVDFRERIRVNGDFAPDPLLESCAARLLPTADRIGATYFEVATALAFLCFAEAEVEDAVVETGLGGRWDATNVVTPTACVITSLAVDHVDYLGSSLQSISREKAGILKAGVPAVAAPLPPGAHVVEEVASGLDVPLRVLGREASVESIGMDVTGTQFVYRSGRLPTGELLRTSLVGRHQAQNAGLALLALESWPTWPGLESIRDGLADVRLPGRFQIVNRPDGPWVLDIAHNLDAVRHLVETLEEMQFPSPCVALVSVLRDKPWPEMAGALSRACQSAVLTIAPSAPSERRWALDRALQAGPWLQVEASADFEHALRRARELAGVGTVLVTGSAHTVGDALGLLAE